MREDSKIGQETRSQRRRKDDARSGRWTLILFMEKGEEIVPSVGRLVGLKLITARVHGRLRRPAGGGGEGNGGGGHMMYSAQAGGGAMSVTRAKYSFAPQSAL